MITVTRSRKLIQATLLAAALGIGGASTSAYAITDEEAQEIAIDAYVYLYPLVSFDVTRKQFTNFEPGKVPGRGPANTFNSVPTYPPADDRGVVRLNFDTLYSFAFLDLSKEPMVISVPDTGGRYYLLPMLDMWTDVFASPGWRTTGTQAGDFLIAPPGWRPDLREKFDEFRLPAGTLRIDAPTPIVWIIGRTRTDGPPEARSCFQKGPGGRARHRQEAHGMEGADFGASHERLVNEYRHGGRLRQLLSQAGHFGADGAWG